MPFFDSNARLFYTDEGPRDKPTLLLVHGWTCDSNDWIWQIQPFAAEYRVVAIDLPGHGRSSADGPFTVRSFADDLAQLLTALDCRDTVAVGHSLGGVIVSTLAIEHPAQVRAVVTADAGYGMPPELMAQIERMTPRLSGPDAPLVAAEIFTAIEGQEISPALACWHQRRAIGTPPEVVAKTFLGGFHTPETFNARHLATRYLARRTCPVLSVWAESDRAEWELTLALAPGSKVILWPEAGHWLHQSRPEKFNALVLDWVSALARFK
jgi:pimeloyl-ACP methyl ester carboxylesterase